MPRRFSKIEKTPRTGIVRTVLNKQVGGAKLAGFKLFHQVTNGLSQENVWIFILKEQGSSFIGKTLDCLTPFLGLGLTHIVFFRGYSLASG